MATLAELVEAPVDWLASVSDADLRALEDQLAREGERASSELRSKVLQELVMRRRAEAEKGQAEAKRRDGGPESRPAAMGIRSVSHQTEIRGVRREMAFGIERHLEEERSRTFAVRQAESTELPQVASVRRRRVEAEPPIRRRRPEPPSKPTPFPSSVTDRFFVEMHELLCKTSAKYRQDRQRLTREFKVGEASLSAAIAATVAPYLGGSSIVVAPAVAVTLTMIGRAGLSTWCAQRGEVRRLGEERHQQAMADYEKSHERYKVELARYEREFARLANEAKKSKRRPRATEDEPPSPCAE